MKDLEAVRVVVETLEPFETEDRERILRWARERLGLAQSIEGRYRGKYVEEWLDDLVSHDGGERTRALEVIQELGPRADAAISRLVERLQVDEHEKWRALMPAEALLQIGRHIEEAGTLIIDCLLQDNPDIQMTAFGSICKNGPRAASLVPHLVKALRSPGENVRKLAAEALGMIGPQAGGEAVRALGWCSTDISQEVRTAAEAAIRRIGSRP